MMQDQKRIISESIVDSSTLDYMNSILDEGEARDRAASVGSVNSQNDDSSSADSYIKMCKITETSPEPDTNNFNPEKGPNDSYFEKKLAVQKKLKWVLFTIVIATSVLFIGTLIGLIIVATFKKPLQSATGKASGTSGSAFVSKVSDPMHPYEFSHFDGTDPEIALAFADHSLRHSFYGVTYDGPGSVADADETTADNRKQRRALPSTTGTFSKSNPQIQRQITQDIALLSRITSRIRLVHHDDMLTDRVMQAVRDLNVNVKLALNVNSDLWSQQSQNIRRILNSYPTSDVESILIEQSSESPDITYKAFKELHEFLNRHEMSKNINLVITQAQNLQANPLKLTVNPRAAIEWINTDYSYKAYTNLETPAETSEKASYMTAWVCGIAPHIRSDIQWYWSNAFDNEAAGVQNGIFYENRKMKPAGLPRCDVY